VDPKERLRRRAIVLTGHAEEMASLIRFHVLECSSCKANICAEGMPALLDRLDAKLKDLCGELKQRDDSSGE
jgi:hypothetical protein